MKTIEIIKLQHALALDAASVAKNNDALIWLQRVKAVFANGVTLNKVALPTPPKGIDEVDDLVDLINQSTGQIRRDDSYHESHWTKVQRETDERNARRASFQQGQK